ncbi:MAG: hypothetical protein ABI831_28780 [Betaproteobacteria bacterium]
MSDSADLCRAFFSSTEHAVFVVEAATGIIADASERAVAETGFSLDELRGISVDCLFRQAEEERPLIACVFARETRELCCRSAHVVARNGGLQRVDLSMIGSTANRPVTY